MGAAIIDLCQPRILARLRSKRLDVSYTRRKDRPFLGTTVQLVIRAVGRHPDKKRNSHEIKTFVNEMIKFGKLLDQVEICSKKDLKSYLESIIRSASGLTARTDFTKIFAGLGPADLDPSTRTSFIICLNKLARYHEAAQFLVQLAMKSGLFKQATVTAVSLEENYFLRDQGAPRDCNLESSLVQCQGGASPLGVNEISRRLKQGTQKTGADFKTTFTKVLCESKIHAEIQLVAHCELNQVSRPPRVICSSKDACYLCNEFVRLHGKFYIPKTHGNLYTGWFIPPVPSLNPAHDQLNKFLRAQVKKKIQEFQNDPSQIVSLMRNDNESTIFPFSQLMASLDGITAPPEESSTATVLVPKDEQRLAEQVIVVPQPAPQPVLKPSPAVTSKQPVQKQKGPSIATVETTNSITEISELPDQQKSQPKPFLQKLKRLVSLLGSCWSSEDPITIRGRSRKRGLHYSRSSSS